MAQPLGARHTKFHFSFTLVELLKNVDTIAFSTGLENKIAGNLVLEGQSLLYS